MSTWEHYEAEVARYEAEHNRGRRIPLWRPEQVAGLLEQTPAAVRRKMGDPLHPLGFVSIQKGGGKKPRWRVERDNLIQAMMSESEARVEYRPKCGRSAA